MTTLSHSKVQTYLESSMKYKLHYLDKIRPTKTKSAFVFGSALDAAINVLLRQESLEKAKRVFQYRLSNIMLHGKRVKVKTTDSVIYTKKDLDEELLAYYGVRDSDNPAWESLRVKGLLLIEAYKEQVMPKIAKVFNIQKNIALDNPDGDRIVGVLDAVVLWEDGKTYIIDNKTSTVKYEEDSVRQSNQLVLYYYIEKDHLDLDGAGFIVLDKNINKNRKKRCTKCGNITTGKPWTCDAINQGTRCNGSWEILLNPTVNVDFIFSEDIQSEDEDRVISEFDKVNQGIADGVFQCGENGCMTKYGPCIYRNFCEDGNMEGLVNVKK